MLPLRESTFTLPGPMFTLRESTLTLGARILRPACERGEQDGDGVVEGDVRVQFARRVVDHDGEDEPLARGAEDVAGERGRRAERAGLGADVTLRGRALHVVAQRG